MDSLSVSKNSCRRLRIVSRTIMVGVLTWSLFGCVGLGSAKENLNVYADSALRVSLETDPTLTSDTSTHHSHPIDFPLSEVTLLLTGLEAERDLDFMKSLVKEKERVPVFTPEETKVLAPQLQKALGQVLPLEWVTFKVSYPTASDEATVTSGSVWVQGRQIFITLDHYRSSMEPPQSVIPGPYGSSFSRRPAGDHRRLPDFTVHFSPDQAVIKQQLTATAQMFASPETQVVIDRLQLAQAGKDVSSDVHARSSSEDNKVPTLLPSRACSKQLTEMGMKVKSLTDRVKMQETQISDLLGIVKKLTKSH